MDKKNFINSIKEGALKGQMDYGILPSLTIAQAILESSWGRSELAVKAKNLFGIKAFSNWKEKRITLPTTEWYHGQRKIIEADFRVYDSINGSILDHNQLLASKRYEKVRGCKDYKTGCREIYYSGYATDPQYPEKLISIIEENRLYNFDCGQGLTVVAIELEEHKVKNFQQLCHILGVKDCEGKALKLDNILGARTISCLKKMPMLMEGSKGPAVEFIQKVIKTVPVDGDFGHITKCAVMEYQEKKGLTIDGIVGRETWTALLTT